MELIRTAIDGLLLVRPAIFTDERGHFLETFNAQAFRRATGVEEEFVQDNESLSHKGVLRGLHFQAKPHAQAKLVRVAAGAVMDVCVDLREQSPSFGKHVGVRLDAREKAMLYIPAGLAHGFVSLEDNTVFCYKCTAYYAPKAERTLLWNDPALGIDWGVEAPIISHKDHAGAHLADLRPAF